MKTKLPARILICFATIFFCNFYSYSQTTIVANGSSWKYWANTQANFPTGWQNSAFNDASWPSGNAELGYGDGDEATVVTYGSDPNNKYITTYFRKTINVANPSAYGSYTLNIKRDDGFVVYVNGVEVGRDNMPAGVPSYSTLASSAIEDATIAVTVSPSAFVAGNNVIAVEMHQANVTSTDISFNLQLTGSDVFSSTLVRDAYLQMGNQTAITIRWRTSAAQNSRVEVGTVFGTYPTVVTDANSVTEHIVRVTGLTADTKYFYRIGNSTNMGSADPEKFFTTVPPANTTRKVRIAAFGDCGRNSSTYQDENLTNYESFLATNGIDAPDAWILLGDNAYSTGSDAEYTSNFFGIYGNNILKNHKMYPAPGNHDYANNTANKGSRAMPYYSNFSTPQNAECGGVASNKPNFYSYDIGNIHFLSLDAWGVESDGTHMGTSGTSTLKTWLTNDLAANTKKWTIAYWHHSPYTKSSHNSDTETELAAIRQNFIGFLETRGVDLIICGHSHGYERSYLLKNYTGAWNTFNLATHAVSSSSGAYTSSSTCPYTYNAAPANHGTVYVVAGSTGASGGTVAGEFGTNAMPFAVNDAGVLYFEVDDNRLDAKMLRRNGTVFDQFTIMKDVKKTTSYTIAQGQSITLTASWPGSGTYAWNNAQTGRAITVTPPLGINNFNVTDAYGCVTDQFNVTVNTTLPLTLSAYDVALDKNAVFINWTTATEKDTKTFTVERSLDGVAFKPIQQIAAAGNSTNQRKYSLVDKQPLKGISYYRLSQQDINNQTKLFDVKKIINSEGKLFDVKVFAQGDMVTARITSTQKENFFVAVYDMNARLVDKATWTVEAGITEKQINLAKGTYIMHFVNERGEKYIQKIMVQ